MSPPARINSRSPDWLATCRRAGSRVRSELARLPNTTDRDRPTGTGRGGDTTLVIDSLAEQAVIAEFESLGAAVTIITEELGEVGVCGGGPTRVVVDPIDGSLNAKRGLAPYALSIAVSETNTMEGVYFGYVCDLAHGEEWWAHRTEGAFCQDRALESPGHSRLELLGVESTTPENVVRAAPKLGATGARRLRAVGSIALSLCFVASGRLDGLVTLGAARSVDCAAGQLIVREADGAVQFVDTDGPLEAALGLEMRSRLAAASSQDQLQALIATIYDQT